MWHLPNKMANPHGGSQLVVYYEPPATPQMHTPTHTHRESTATMMHVKLSRGEHMLPKEGRFNFEKTEIIKTF